MTFPTLIKTTLAILLLLCLLKLPYGYYQLVRFIALVGFAFLAHQAHQKENLTGAFIYVALANGLVVGSYHYFRTTSTIESRFKNFISTVKKSEQDLIPIS